jgi:hypothetical protein
MKKIAIFIQLIVLITVYSTVAKADDDDWDDDYVPPPQVNYYYPAPPVTNYYPQPQVNNYYPQPIVNNYYQQPPVYNYPPQPSYYGRRMPSAQGLAGSVIGDVIGYELGGGNPVTSGLGAAVGAILGNGSGYY